MVSSSLSLIFIIPFLSLLLTHSLSLFPCLTAPSHFLYLVLFSKVVSKQKTCLKWSCKNSPMGANWEFWERLCNGNFGSNKRSISRFWSIFGVTSATEPNCQGLIVWVRVIGQLTQVTKSDERWIASSNYTDQVGHMVQGIENLFLIQWHWVGIPRSSKKIFSGNFDVAKVNQQWL